MLTVKRLDFVSTLDVMLTICDLRLKTVGEKGKKGVEDVIFCLNTALRSIDGYGLAEELNKRIDGDAAAVRGAKKDGGEGKDGEAVDETPAADDGLTHMQAKVLDFIQQHPGCVMDEMVKALGVGNTTISTHVAGLRKKGYAIETKRGGRGGPTTYRVGE